MDFSKVKCRTLAGVACVGMLLASLGCAEEPMDAPDYTVSGREVTISVPLRFPKMDVRTRASHTDADINRVESLWVRTFSSLTGKATSEWKKVNPNTTDTEIGRDVAVEIETLSGATYIVGVANVENPGVKKSAPDVVKPLSELLASADTWADFLDIAVLSPSDFDDVYATPVPLPMSGCYTTLDPGTHSVNLADWQKSNFTEYFIPYKDETVTLQGAIHLRRLVSHITFEIVPGDDVDVTVNSYTVYNVPKFSHLYERAAENGMNANFGDNAGSEAEADGYFAKPIKYSSQYIDKNESGHQSFDWWQSESKHSSSSVTDYNNRDLVDANGLFTSLTGDAWTPANMASYVRIECTVEYKDRKEVDDNGNPALDGKPMHREGNADYLVHLGYVGENPSPGDFNCYRNTNYRYILTVKGMEHIRLDAFSETETYHGEEGVVSDLEHATIELDAHYNAFNIQLTQEELSASDFGYVITSYYGGKRQDVDDKTDLESVDEKFYDWIELRPTDGQYTLAAYKPCPDKASPGTTDGKTFRLADMRKGDKATVWENLGENRRSSSGWYTVFVNENTYESTYDYGNGEYGNESGSGDMPDWANYVNQDPRRFFIRVTKKESPDGKSVYSRSKYGISQSSIQTYYSLAKFTDNPSGTAIGVERVNETEGLNMRSSFTDENTSGSNGRYNVALYLGNLTTDVNESERPEWSGFVDQASPMEIPAVTGDRAQGGYELPDRTRNSEAGPLSIPGLTAFNGSVAPIYNDPQGSYDRKYYVEAINACMSRNRDNNGNERIDPEELRWYVPALGKYLRLVLGSQSLTAPLMDYENGPESLPKGQNNGWGGTAIKNEYLTRYMFFTSDVSETDNSLKVLWALEGTSVSTWNEAHSWGEGYPWQVRCIRNLGTDLRGKVTKEDKTAMAYVTSRDDRAVEMKYYDARSVRQTRLSGNGAATGQMPIHDITSPYNQVYSKFQYSDTDIDIDKDDWDIYKLKNYIESNPCGALGDDWRVPNQKELAILRNIGGILVGDYLWLSCTYNYYNGVTGAAGGEFVNGQSYFLGMLSHQGTQLNASNVTSKNGKVRCVRDVR